MRLSLRCEWWPSPGVLCFQSTVKLEVGEQSSKPEASKSEKNELQCDICRKSLKTKKSLAQHMRLVHDITPTRVKRGGNKKGVRGDFPCEECGNHFKTMNGLKVHMGTIHKERRGRRGKGPFKCELCDSRFSQRANIRLHMIHIHRIVPPAERAQAMPAGDFAKSTFGAEVVAHYTHYFRTEQAAYDMAVTDWERKRYFERI